MPRVIPSHLVAHAARVLLPPVRLKGVPTLGLLWDSKTKGTKPLLPPGFFASGIDAAHTAVGEDQCTGLAMRETSPPPL